MIKKTVLWTRIDGGLSITYYDDQDDYNEIIRKHITNFGGVIKTVFDGVIQKPATRENRDCWIYDDVSNSVKVCPIKLAAKESDAAKKALEKNAVLTKLGITEDELKKVIK